MSSSALARWGGLAAMLGGAVGIVLTPILTYLWATYSDAYGYFGRAYSLVPLGLLLGVTGLYALRREDPEWRSTDNVEREIVGMTFVGLATALVGTVLDYGGGGSGEGFTRVQITGFGLEIIGSCWCCSVHRCSARNTDEPTWLSSW